MAVLDACQSAFVRLVGRKPTTIFSSSNQMELEIADLANEVAGDIMRSADWRALTKIETLTGDGTTTAFPVPADYDRMVQAQEVLDGTNWLWGYTAVADLTEWMRITTSGFTAITPGWWILLDGQMQFSPAPTSGAEAKFPYISNLIGATQAGVPISVFTSDTDTFKLGDNLLTLGLVWRWKAQKGLEYAEDMTNYEVALSQAQTRDKGSRVIRKGRPGRMPGIYPAWPWPLG